MALAKSLMSNMVIASRRLLAADSTLLAWSNGKIHRTRDLGPAMIDGKPCRGNHIVTCPGTILGQPNPNNESEALYSVAFGVAFTQRYATLEDADEDANDVRELVEARLMTDQTFQTTHGSKLAMRIFEFPLIDAEARFTPADSPLGFLVFESTYVTRIDFKTRALLLT